MKVNIHSHQLTDTHTLFIQPEGEAENCQLNQLIEILRAGNFKFKASRQWNEVENVEIFLFKKETIPSPDDNIPAEQKVWDTIHPDSGFQIKASTKQ